MTRCKREGGTRERFSTPYKRCAAKLASAVSAGVLVSTDGCERLALSEGLAVACALFESPGWTFGG